MINLSREKFNLILKSILVIAIVLLSSCLTLESHLSVNQNGSGSISFIYTLDKALNNISNLGEKDDIVPLNLSEEYIGSITTNNPGLKYSNYSTKEDEKNLYISVDFEFETIDDLNKLLPVENKIVISKKNNETTFSQTLVEETEEINSESMDIYRDLFKEHSVLLTVNTPENIINVEGGIKKSNKVAVYQSSIVDILENGNSIKWDISW